MQTDGTAETGGRKLSVMDCEECVAVPGETMIDVLHPITGRTVCYDKTLEQIRAERPEYAGAERMTVEAFCAAKAARQRTPITWDETTEAKFTEMLEVLPPAAMVRGGFLVGEPWDHDAGNGQPRFDAFRQIGDRFEAASRPMTRAEFRAEMG
jgi:hypothetical protein